MSAPLVNARAAHLPSQQQLQYVQTLLTVIGLVLVTVWIAGRVLENPSNLVRIARKKVG